MYTGFVQLIPSEDATIGEPSFVPLQETTTNTPLPNASLFSPVNKLRSISSDQFSPSDDEMVYAPELEPTTTNLPFPYATLYQPFHPFRLN